MNKTTSDFRNYELYNEGVIDTYKKARQFQTTEFVQNIHKKYLKFDKSLNIWSAIDLLSKFIDKSDPDINLPNNMHLFQTAERIRKDNLPDWMQLIGLIHDLGKILYLIHKRREGLSNEEQWAIVGDTFITGCKIPNTIVLPEFNNLNPDMKNENTNTTLGIYQQNCGLENCIFSFGHDEYLYQVLQYNNEFAKKNNINITSLPLEAYYIVRYHSCYLWHDKNEYSQFENETDKKMKNIVKQFNQYDLYTKSDTNIINIDELKIYYTDLMKKYLSPNLTLYF